MPFIIFLHGYFEGPDDICNDMFVPSDVFWQETDRKFMYACPEARSMYKPAWSANGTVWDATDGCCKGRNYGDGDVHFLNNLTSWATHDHNASDIAIIGFSNGGFMAHRMACETDRLKGIVAINGVTFKEANDCINPGHLNVIQIGSNDDQRIRPIGGTYPGCIDADCNPYASFQETVDYWRGRLNCGQASPVHQSDAILTSNNDLLASVGGSVDVANYTCSNSARVSSWTLQGRRHSNFRFNMSRFHEIYDLLFL